MVHDYDYDQTVQIWVSFGGSSLLFCNAVLGWEITKRLHNIRHKIHVYFVL